jgi:SEC-C motif domain protein
MNQDKSVDKILCPCKSNSLYKNCCGRYHLGEKAPSALLLMRSRFSAYALGLSDYIISTTHKDNPSYQKNHSKWNKAILEFSSSCSFDNLTILSHQESINSATVSFFAEITVKNDPSKDVSIRELSYFKKEKGAWLYLNRD